MAASPSKADREDFAGFCRNATDSQLTFIVEKERAANHRVYAQIARDEIIRRGARENRAGGTRRRTQRAEGGHALTLDPTRAAHWLYRQETPDGYKPSVTVAIRLKALLRDHRDLRARDEITRILDAMRSSAR